MSTDACPSSASSPATGSPSAAASPSIIEHTSLPLPKPGHTSSVAHWLQYRTLLTTLTTLRKVADAILLDNDEFYMPASEHLEREMRQPKMFSFKREHRRANVYELAFCFAPDDLCTPCGTQAAILVEDSARALVERMMVDRDCPPLSVSGHFDKDIRLDVEHARDYRLTLEDAERLLQFCDKLQDEAAPYRRLSTQLRHFVRCIVAASIERTRRILIEGPLPPIQAVFDWLMLVIDQLQELAPETPVLDARERFIYEEALLHRDDQFEEIMKVFRIKIAVRDSIYNNPTIDRIDPVSGLKASDHIQLQCDGLALRHKRREAATARTDALLAKSAANDRAQQKAAASNAYNTMRRRYAAQSVF